MKLLSFDFRRAPFVIAALVASAVLLVVTACGGGDSSDRSTSEGTAVSASAITKAELIKKADVICRQTDKIQKDRFSAYSVKHELVLENSPEMRMVMKKILLPPIGVELEKIAALGVPAGDEAEMKAIMTGWERALKITLQKPEILLVNAEGPFAKPNKLAGKYGFKDCDSVF